MASVDVKCSLVQAEIGSLRVCQETPDTDQTHACVEGRPSGLPLFDSLVLLGREVAIERVAAAQERLAGTV